MILQHVSPWMTNEVDLVPLGIANRHVFVAQIQVVKSNRFRLSITKCSSACIDSGIFGRNYGSFSTSKVMVPISVEFFSYPKAPP
jgi:hypothetical protein